MGLPLSRFADMLVDLANTNMGIDEAIKKAQCQSFVTTANEQVIVLVDDDDTIRLENDGGWRIAGNS